MLVAVIFLAAAILFGISLAAATNLLKEGIERLAAGIVIGLSLATFLGFAISLLIPVGLPLLLLVIIALIAASLYLTYQYRSVFSWPTWDRVAVITTIALLLFLTPLSLKVLSDENGALATGIINNYGDVAWHTAIATSFTADHAVPPINPIYAGTKLVYPFLTDFLSSLLITGGLSLPTSFVIPTIILLPSMFLLLYALTKQLTSSRPAAVIAVLLFLFAGSTLGWLQLTDYTSASHYLTGSTDNIFGYHLLNPLLGLILPQRSLLFGLPLALLIILLLTRPSKTNNTETPYFLAGALAGLLPLFHAHTVLALVPVILGLMILKPTPRWLYFVLPASIIGLPQVLYYFTAETNGASFIWRPGWMKPTDMSVVVYWLKNSGLLIPVTLAGLFLPISKNLKTLTIAGLLLFVAANLWLIARWEWDNTKIFIYWLLFTSPLIAWTIIAAIKRTPRWAGILIGVIAALHIASGSIDLSRLLVSQQSYTVWNADQLELAELITANVPPSATIVTAPVHNSGIELTGRARYLGYSGHLWSHGIDASAREQAITNLLSGTAQQLPDQPAQYILIGPAERQQYPNLTIQPTWQPIATTGPYTLYKVF